VGKKQLIRIKIDSPASAITYLSIFYLYFAKGKKVSEPCGRRWAIAAWAGFFRGGDLAQFC
jgi:hypothetical protein